NRVDLMVHYVACLKAGLVITPLNYRYQPPEMDHALEVSGASLLLAHIERKEDVASTQMAALLPLGVIYYGGDENNPNSFESLLVPKSGVGKLDPPEPGAIACIFFTSGSTGKPKGVTHSHETLGWMLALANAGFEISPEDVLLPASSISHMGGFASSLCGLMAGVPVGVTGSFEGEELLTLLRELRPTAWWMLPAAMHSLVHHGGATRDDFSTVRLCVVGGDKVPLSLEKEFQEISGIQIDETYGMTEIGYTTTNPPSGANKPGSIGRLIAGYEMSLRDDAGNEVPVGEQGRLWIKSPATMVGYWNRPDATQETIVDGWLDTGDVMRVDEDGYLWFCGRKKQIIIHDGSNICPQEVEEALLEHPAVESAGVVGIHDLIHGENVRAYITVQPNATPSIPELIQHARERIGYKAPDEIIILEEMPLNPAGKVDRVSLKRTAEQHQLSEEIA
ncbi:MAG: AMP-binding protein, partial [Pirellulales bacterium]